MIKRYGIVSIIVAGMLTSLNARTYSQDEMDKILQRLDKLEKAMKAYQIDTKEQIEELKASTEDELDALNERADENEFQATMNRIKWGAEFEVTDNFIDGTYGSMPQM